MSARHRLELISFDLCPYVERSRIVLEEKKVPYETRLVDLRNKPDWFLAISPRGKVPVLLVDDRPVFESMVINEMLEELYPEKPMFPSDPVTRALARAWIVFSNDVLMPLTYELGGAASGEPRKATAAKVDDAFSKLERQLATGSPRKYFLGDAFGLVDAAYAPTFGRWFVSDEIAKHGLLEKYPGLTEYARRITEYPSARAARAENFHERYAESVRARLQSAAA